VYSVVDEARWRRPAGDAGDTSRPYFGWGGTSVIENIPTNIITYVRI